MKHDIDDVVTTKQELTIYIRDEDTGEEYEQVVPHGAVGVIESVGKSSVYDFEPMYTVLFKFDGNEVDVTFFENDIDDVCEVLRVSANETTEQPSA
jgi:hypothetical protein